MSLKLSSPSLVASTINTLTIIGLSLIIGSISALVIGSMIAHNFLFTGLSYVMPLFIVGIVVIWSSSKLSEILEK